MQPRSKSKLWANDTLIATSTDQRKMIGDKQSEVRKGDQKSKLNESDEEENRSSETLDADKPQNPVHDDVISDMDYFRSRVKKEWSDSEGEDGENEDSYEEGDIENGNSDSRRQTKDEMDIEDEDEDEEDVQQENDKDGDGEEPVDELIETEGPSSTVEDPKEVLESGRLFVRNLPYTTT